MSRNLPIRVTISLVFRYIVWQFITLIIHYKEIVLDIYKHDAIDTADPSSIQDACHVNFVIGMSHRRVSVARKVRYNSLFLSNEDYLIV